MADAIIPSTCVECATHCGSLVTVRDGTVVDIAPNPKHPFSQGAFCIKGIRGLKDGTYQESRPLHPLKRTGARGEGKFARISWDEALDYAAENFARVRAEYGPPSLCGAVSNANQSRGVFLCLMLRSFGSPNWMINQDLCTGCRAVSDRATGLGIHFGEDIRNAACALVVGRNPSAADPAQWLALKELKKRGGRIVALDPARTPVCELADVWLRPRPGTDAAIAMAMIHWLIEQGCYDKDFVQTWTVGFDKLAARAANYTPARAAELTGVPADDIIAAARHYADGPAVLVAGHGIDAFSAGVQTARAFHCLVAVSGNLDRKGGNRRNKKPNGFRGTLEILHDPAFRLPLEIEKQTLGADKYPLWAGPEGWQTACHNPTVIEAMLTGKPYPVRALYVSGVNIAVTYPDTQRTVAALKALDFLCVVTSTMTPTALLADLVLPKTTGLEEDEVMLQPAGPCLDYMQAAIPPRGEARDDFWIARALIDRMAERQSITRDLMPWRTKREYIAYTLKESGIPLETLAAQGFATFPYRLGNFDRKIELYSEKLAKLGLDPLPDHVPPTRERIAQPDGFPLVLLTGAREKSYHHSRFREMAWARKVSPDPVLQMNPDTARAEGVATDDWVALETPSGQGTCRLRIKVTDDVLPGVVRTGMGWWLPEATDDPLRGATTININAAMGYAGPYDPMSGSADTRGLMCRIKRIAA